MVPFKKLLDRVTGSKRLPARRSSRNSTILRLERLEERAVPIATGTLTGTTLSIVGNGEPIERIAVFRNEDTNQLVLTNFGQVTQQFDSAAVDSITIMGTGLNVQIRVAPNVLQTTTIVGGPGENNLDGGGGQSFILGGDGANRIVNGNGDNGNLAGGAGVNTFIDPTATGTIIMAAGRSVFYGSMDRSTILSFNPALDRDYRCETTQPLNAQTLGLAPSPFAVLDPNEVGQLLDRASAATASQDGIIAIVDRTGRILGVRIEDGVFPTLLGIAPPPAGADDATLTAFYDNLTADQKYLLAFAVDGAVAKARTGAFFGNNEAPLTSRTIQNISQTTMTEREINAYPFITDENSTLRGPGFVAPIGIKGHFPPGVPFTPQVDLFAIEHTNRDSTYHPNADRIKGTADDQLLLERFNINSAFIPQPIDQRIAAPDSYGYASGLAPQSQNRGIATLPGGIPIYKNADNGQPVVVGGIGVFYPGATGFASEENSNLNENFDPSRPDRSLEAEFAAFAALGGAPLLAPQFAVGALGGIPPVPGIILPISAPNNMRIDLVGITLDIVGPLGTNGPQILLDFATANYPPGMVSGAFAPLLNPGADNKLNPSAGPGFDGQTPFVPNPALPIDTMQVFALQGTFAPEGFLVTPQDSKFPEGLKAQDVQRLIEQGVQQALITRAAIRLPLDRNTVMVVAVADLDGEIIGLFRMPDSTFFSIDVAVSKARNVVYYAGPNLQPADQLPGIPEGVAFTNRTFRYLSLPRFPEGIDGLPPGPFSILNDPNVNPFNGTLVAPPNPAIDYQSVQGFDAFHPQTNFRDPNNPLNQSGIVFFPGAVPTYRFGFLAGGLGVSGDGVDQDDVVTHAAKQGYNTPPTVLRADQVFFTGVRLPYQKFNRQPLNP